jgi:hypothetical protein
MPEHLLLAFDFVSSIVVCEIILVEYVVTVCVEVDVPLGFVLVTDVVEQVQV